MFFEKQKNVNFITKPEGFWGFSLAEVLLTLAIVGVLSGLIIPGLVTKIQEAGFRESFKKVFAELSAATNSIKQENGGTLVNAFPPYYLNGTLNSQTVRDFYIQKLSVIKSCNDGVGVCSAVNGVNKTLAGDLTDDPNASYMAKVVLKNGMFISFGPADSTCSSLNRCVSMYVDVNGFKGPNQMGRDIFSITVTPEKLMPSGDWYTCQAIVGHTRSGWGCSTNVLLDKPIP